MIVDTLANAKQYEAMHPLFKAAFDFLRTQPLAELPNGKVEIQGDKLYASVQTPGPKAKADCKLELHRKYIDIQYTVSGQEEMGWSPVAGLGHPGEFQVKDDYALATDAPQSWFDVRPGMFAVFFPEDAHAPNASCGEHKKIVVKVAVE